MFIYIKCIHFVIKMINVVWYILVYKILEADFDTGSRSELLMNKIFSAFSVNKRSFILYYI